MEYLGNKQEEIFVCFFVSIVNKEIEEARRRKKD